jgi:hypothetical protein
MFSLDRRQLPKNIPCAGCGRWCRPCPWHDMVVAQSTELEAKRHMIGNSQPCVTSGNEGSHCGFEQEDLVCKCLSLCCCHLPMLCSLVVVNWSWPKLAGARRTSRRRNKTSWTALLRYFGRTILRATRWDPTKRAKLWRQQSTGTADMRSQMERILHMNGFEATKRSNLSSKRTCSLQNRRRKILRLSTWAPEIVYSLLHIQLRYTRAMS